MRSGGAYPRLQRVLKCSRDLVVSSFLFMACQGTATAADDVTAEAWTRFQSGSLTLDCEFLCSASYIFHQREIYKLYTARDWKGLARRVMKTKWRQDITYFLLGDAAGGLQLYPAAEHYYRMAAALSTGDKPAEKCASAGTCGQFVFPRDINDRLQAIATDRKNGVIRDADAGSALHQSAEAAREGMRNPPPLSPAAQAGYDAVLRKGCSPNWAHIEASSLAMKPETAHAWLNFMANSRLQEVLMLAAHYGDGGYVDDFELSAAQNALTDWHCGALPEDDVSIAGLMYTIGVAYQGRQQFDDAERVRREAVKFVHEKLPTRADLMSPAMRALAETLESKSDFAGAQSLRKQALELTSSSHTPPADQSAIDVDIFASLRAMDTLIGAGLTGMAENSARYSLSQADARSVPDDQTTDAVLDKLISILQSEQKFDEAEQLLGRRGRIKSPSAEIATEIRMQRIANLVEQKRYTEASSLLLEEMESAKRSSDQSSQLATEKQYGELLTKQENYVSAEPILRSALKRADQLRAPGNVYDDLAYTLSLALRMLGRYPESATLAQEALVDDQKRAGIVDGKLPDNMFGSSATRIIAAGTSAAAFSDYTFSLVELAAALEGEQQFDRARQLCERALSVTAQQIEIERSFDPEAHTAAVRDGRRYAATYLLPALWAIDDKTRHSDGKILSEALENAQFESSSAAADALGRTVAKIAAGSRGLSSVVDERKALQEEYAALQKTDTELLSKAGPDAYEARLREKQQSAALYAKLDANSAVFKDKFPSFWSLLDADAVPLSELQGASGKPGLLHSDEALLFVVEGTPGIFVFAVTNDSTAWSKSALSKAQLDLAVRKLRCGLDHELCNDPRATDTPFDRQAAFAIYKGLFGDPSIAKILASRHKIIAVVNQALTSLPLGLLVTEPPQGDDFDQAAMRTTHWLIAQRSIAVAPTLSSLRALRKTGGDAAKPNAEPFLGFAPSFQLAVAQNRGVPQSSRSYYFDGKPLMEEIRKLPNLSGDREVESLRSTLNAPPDSIFVGARASKAQVLDLDDQGRLGRARIIEFATHGLLSGTFGLGEPALILAPPPAGAPESARNDAILKSSDIAALHLNADWVILSACNTGAGDKPEAEGLSGLARAFFIAGAKSLLVSHWAVGDEAALALVTGTVRHQRADITLSRADALRLAELDILNDPTSAMNPFPATWAPFVYIGID